MSTPSVTRVALRHLEGREKRRQAAATPWKIDKVFPAESDRRGENTNGFAVNLKGPGGQSRQLAGSYDFPEHGDIIGVSFQVRTRGDVAELWLEGDLVRQDSAYEWKAKVGIDLVEGLFVGGPSNPRENFFVEPSFWRRQRDYVFASSTPWKIEGVNATSGDRRGEPIDGFYVDIQNVETGERRRLHGDYEYVSEGFSITGAYAKVRPKGKFAEVSIEGDGIAADESFDWGIEFEVDLEEGSFKGVPYNPRKFISPKPTHIDRGRGW